MKRREFIKNTAAGSLLSGIGLEQLAHQKAASAAQQTSVGEKPLVTIAASNEPELRNPAPLDAELTYQQVRDIVWLALDRDTSPRSLPKIVKKNNWVVIKTNIVRVVWLSREGYYGRPGLAPDFERDEDALALITDLRVVKAVAEYLIEKVAPRRITIAEGPAEWYNSKGKIKPGNYIDGWHYEFKGFDNLSYTKIVEQLNGKNKSVVDIVDLNEDAGVYVTDFDPYKTGIGALQFTPPGDRDGTSDKAPSRRKGVFIPKTVLEKDILITIPVLKTHGSVGTTLFMKNFIGCVHSTSYDPKVTHKGVFHKGSDLNLVRGIVDLTCAIKPDYGVAEGFWAVMNHNSGQMGIGINHNVVIAGGDIVAAEAVANMAMGFNPLDFDILRWAHMKKLGEWRPDRIGIAGPPVKSIRVNYARAANKYVARGIRKWQMLGPFQKPLDKAGELKPKSGDRLAENEWKLLDGDTFIDNEPLLGRGRYQDCLLYSIPGSDAAEENSLFYLALTVNGLKKGIVGQLLFGIDGGSFRAFLNGRGRSYSSTPLQYDPTPSTFITLLKGENTLVVEVKKTNAKNQPVKIAANICDLDGDRLEDITFDPAGE
ncbi:MAG: DUF362 domain-containing protein [Candidatus Latescibacter sp.]|nr:DUF362 domain-containing protein [Candidatus Latescibacter sp.]